MCDPLTIAGIALTAGSTIANTIAANKQRKARDDALAAERIRQRGLDREADALNVQSQNLYEDFGEQQGERASELGEFFTDQQIERGTQNAEAAQELNIPQTSSNITVREEEKQRGKADAFSNQQGLALGDLRAFGDLLGSTGREQARDAMEIGQIGGFKRGSQNVLPLELEEANNAGSGLRMFGDLLNLGGGLALNSGLSGGSPFGGGGVRMSSPFRAPPRANVGLVGLY